MTSIVLIHGAFSHSGHFDGWKRGLAAAGHDCHAPDLPGHGATAGDLTALALPDYLAALQEFIAGLAQPPVLIGHSMGGLLAQQLAALTPCRALVCVASAPPWMLTAQPRTLPALLPLMPKILAGVQLQASVQTLRQHVLHDLAPEEAAALLPTFGAESGRAYRAMILGLARLTAPAFRGPTLCISGDDDHIISQRMSAAIARLYSAQHRRFRGYGHWLIAGSRAEAMVALIDGWLRELPDDVSP